MWGDIEQAPGEKYSFMMVLSCSLVQLDIDDAVVTASQPAQRSALGICWI
jgi:hypothetical protein